MYQKCCRKCASMNVHTEQKGSNTGLYCDDCGAWIAWLGKDDLRAFEHSQKDDRNDMVVRLKEFAQYLDETITSEMLKPILSPAEAIRKSSYCLALERNKNAILNIIEGKDCFEVD